MADLSSTGQTAGVPPRVVALAASAGGLEAFICILGALPANFPLPVLLMMHLDPRHASLLPDLLSRRTPLRVVVATDGALLEPGVVYVSRRTATCGRTHSTASP